ncbi:MAG: hypothetical protein ACPLKQ_08850 [Candidatus Bathyarchaeales archaeon]
MGRDERISRRLEAFSKLVEDFDQRLMRAKAKGVWLCPKCFSDNVIRKDRPRPLIGKLGRLKCKDCGHVYREEKLPIDVEAPARIVDQVIDLTVLGLRTEDIHKEVLQRARSYGFRYNFGRTTIYEIREKVVEVLAWLDRFIVVGLLEGIKCDRLECDETFHSKKQSKKLKEYLEGGDNVKPPRFMYVINGISSNRYPLPPVVAEARNKNAFVSYVLRVGPFLRSDPNLINCDQLKQMVNALKLRFPKSNVDTTIRTKHGKTMMGKTAHIERLNRMYRKALPKRVRVWNKSATSHKVYLCRFVNIYLKQHETLGKRVVEALGIPWPRAIETVPDLIYFAKYIQKYASMVLGDEIGIFNSPILGRVVITVNVPTEICSLIKSKIAGNPWVVIGLNAWVPYGNRIKLVEGLNGEPLLNIDVGTELNICFMRVLLEEGRMHLVGDVLAEPYFMIVPLVGGGICALAFEKVWVDAGKVNHYVFDLTENAFLGQIKLLALNHLACEFLRSKGYRPRALWKDVLLANNSDGKVDCAKEVEVPAQDWLGKLSGIIDKLNSVAEHFDASHLLSIAVWVANEILIRRPRPSSIVNVGSDTATLVMFAAFYKVLNEILGVSFSDYCNVVGKLGVDVAKVEEFAGLISVNFEGLCARLFHVKTPLDINFEAYRESVSSL